jgi:isopenicillin N synthase-like dioxygenase
MTGPARGEFDSVPLVDISGLASADLGTRRATALAIDNAARTAGFFYVSNHGLSASVVADLTDAAARFFALPDAVKLRYYIGRSRNHRGYVPPGEEAFYGQTQSDTKEAFDLSLELPPTDPDFLAGNRLLGPNVWPVEVERFRERVYAYYEAVVALGRRLCRGLLLALDLPEDRFDALTTKPPVAASLDSLSAAARSRRCAGHRGAHRLRVLHDPSRDGARARSDELSRSLGRRAADRRRARHQHR